MIHKRAMLAAALLLGSPTVQPAWADHLDDVKVAGKLVCGVLGGYEPFGFQDPATREVNGYEPDLCRALAAYLNVEPNLKVITAQGRVPELQQGRVDLEAALLGWSKEREAQVDYSNVYAVVDSKILVMRASGVAAPDQLATRKIGVAKGSLLEGIAQAHFPKATVVSFDDTPEAYLALRQGKIAGLLMTETTLASLRALDPQGDRTMLLTDIYEHSQQAFALRKGEAGGRLMMAINTFLSQFERSGAAQKLYDKWFGSQSKLHMTRTVAVGTPINRE